MALKKLFVRSALAISATVLWLRPAPAQAAFLDPYWSARVAALGGAYTAVSDDASGLFYNPAAAVGLRERQTTFTYAKLFTGLDAVDMTLNQVGFLNPLGKSALLGIGWSRFNSTDLYREDTYVFSYARGLRDLLGETGPELSLGVSLKYLSRGFVLDSRSAGDPVFKDGNSRQAVAIDLHAYSVPLPDALPGLALGLTARSLNRPDIGFQDKEELPLEVVGGLRYDWRNLRIPLDVVSRDGELGVKVGTEISFLDRHMFLRMGSDTNQFGMGFGYVRDFNKRFSVVFDYAFLWPLAMEETAGSHRATLGLKF